MRGNLLFLLLLLAGAELRAAEKEQPIIDKQKPQTERAAEFPEFEDFPCRRARDWSCIESDDRSAFDKDMDRFIRRPSN